VLFSITSCYMQVVLLGKEGQKGASRCHAILLHTVRSAVTVALGWVRALRFNGLLACCPSG